jgi:hypothetical protein
MEKAEKLVREGSVKLAKLAENLGIRNVDPDCGKIFVTGGTGVVGHRVALRFLKDGYADIRLGSHRPETLLEMKELGAEVVDFNWDDEKTYGKALEGVKSVLCVIVYHKGTFRCSRSVVRGVPPKMQLIFAPSLSPFRLGEALPRLLGGVQEGWCSSLCQAFLLPCPHGR